MPADGAGEASRLRDRPRVLRLLVALDVEPVRLDTSAGVEMPLVRLSWKKTEGGSMTVIMFSRILLRVL